MEVYNIMSSLLFLIVPLSALFVYWDATKNKIGILKDENGKRQKGSFSALELALTTLLLWIYGFPLYIIKRKSLIQKAKENPIESKNRDIFLKIFAIIAGIGLVFCILFFNNEYSRLEKASIPVVNDILKNQISSVSECVEIKIDKKLAKNLYSAKAILTNGNQVQITIYDKGSEIKVEIPLNQ